MLALGPLSGRYRIKNRLLYARVAHSDLVLFSPTNHHGERYQSALSQSDMSQKIEKASTVRRIESVTARDTCPELNTKVCGWHDTR